MNLLSRILLILCFTISCKQEVNFSASESTPLLLNPSPNDELIVDEPTPISNQAPIINIIKKATDHFIGESTSVVFEIIKGDNPLDSIECFLDKKELPCDFKSTILDFKDLVKGDHEISILLKDTKNLSDHAQSKWNIFERFIGHSNTLSISSQNSVADILFVIDNSLSMHEEQQGIANKISNFFDKIKGLNWRLGIITTDPYEFDPSTKKHNPLADGVLLKFPNGNYFIDSNLNQGQAKKLFSETIYRPERGNGHERGIYNTFRSIERSQDSSQPANIQLGQFYRSSAALSVVLISDENETLVNGVGAPLPDLNKSKGEELLKLVKKTWGNKKLFQFNSVIVRPNDNFCIGADEKFGYAYYELSRLTDGVVEDICASDYTGALKNIGSEVANLQKRYNLDCIPVDTDGDTLPNVEVLALGSQGIPNYVVNGDYIEFDKPLSNGSYQVKYFCSK